jgi:hypothetical protein
MPPKKTPSPLGTQVKGILILQEGDEISSQTCKLMESFNCEVLNSTSTRVMIKGTLGNIQSIKQCWLSKDEKSKLSVELNEYIQQIIIGGRA